MVDALGEGSGLVRRLAHGGIDALDVSMSGLGAAVTSSDVLLLEAVAVGPGGFVAVSGSLAAAAVARHAGVPVWVAAGVGRLLPGRMWDVAGGPPSDAGRRPVGPRRGDRPADLVDAVVGPAGLQAPADALRRTDCPVAPELFDAGHAPGTYRQ